MWWCQVVAFPDMTYTNIHGTTIQVAYPCGKKGYLRIHSAPFRFPNSPSTIVILSEVHPGRARAILFLIHGRISRYPIHGGLPLPWMSNLHMSLWDTSSLQMSIPPKGRSKDFAVI
ncbi:hypothetical protein ACEPAF_4010 [Sanghuangporus sanghuang]